MVVKIFFPLSFVLPLWLRLYVGVGLLKLTHRHHFRPLRPTDEISIPFHGFVLNFFSQTEIKFLIDLSRHLTVHYFSF